MGRTAYAFRGCISCPLPVAPLFSPSAVKTNVALDFDELIQTMAFLREIGFEVEVVSGAAGHVQGVRIQGGVLFVDPAAHASTLLHEAGHLAVLPGRFRPRAEGNITRIQRIICNEVDFSNPDEGEARIALQCGDAEATAWAWAAGRAIGLEPHRIIQDHEYGNTGDEVRFGLQLNAHLGINGLAATKLCVVRDGPLAVAMGLPAYPRLARWLQP